MSKRNRTSDKPKCGLVMPIATLGSHTAAHWRDVKSILTEALQNDFDVELVSEEPEVGVIHSRIVNNIYENPLIVADISALNANVMFELGLRLAFDKPTILIKDESTDWKFDISMIETIEYPKDLRFQPIVDFKLKLLEKALATVKKAVDDPNYSCFLGHFKKLNLDPKAIPEMSVTQFEAIGAQLDNILRMFDSGLLGYATPKKPAHKFPGPLDGAEFHIKEVGKRDSDRLQKQLESGPASHLIQKSWYSSTSQKFIIEVDELNQDLFVKILKELGYPKSRFTIFTNP